MSGRSGSLSCVEIGWDYRPIQTLADRDCGLPKLWIPPPAGAAHRLFIKGMSRATLVAVG